MTTLTVTAKGQVTLKQELLRHLGLQPGQKITVDALPDGRAVIQAEHRGGDIREAFGMLQPKIGKKRVLSVEDMNAIAQQAWADQDKVGTQ
jgi:bifunctional DNA-binding transcriptional regulator/antitoxin component of YhaV-PrlF toxin-antitoxin module